MTHYETLGVPKTASYEDIKRAWRSHAMECHPDRVQNEKMKQAAHDKFIKLSEAYSVLIDESKRRSYDQTITSSQNLSSTASNYSGYQNANPKKDLDDIERIRREVFAESGGEFAKNTLSSVFSVFMFGIITISAFINGSLIIGIPALVLTIYSLKEMYVRAQRVSEWKNNRL
jgi:DnaJ-class molecular chaperone